jgi:hypothetical protein
MSPQINKVSGIATTIRTENGTTFIQYHYTNVVAFNAKTIALNTGGWETATTKNRMNQASNQFELGYRVFAKKSRWFVEFKGQTLEFSGNEIILNR